MIDDAYSPERKYQNSRFRDLSPDRYQHYPQTPEIYARSTCFHNNIMDVDESTSGFIAEGSGGVARKGIYVKNGVRMNGVIKLVLKKKMSYFDLQEVKIALEVQRVVPDYVIETNILERCDILDSITMPDLINTEKDLLLIGMEQGINSVAGEIKRGLSEDNLKQLIKKSLKACYEFNCAGFFHRDIKPANMVVVERKGRQEPVLIDFGETVYMSTVYDYSTGIYRNYNTTKPPFDAMYLGLFFLRDVNNLNVSIYTIKKLQRYYEILMHLEPRFKEINSRIFDHYSLNTPLEIFKEFRKNMNFTLDLEKTEKYLRKHTDRVNFYRNSFNNSMIKEFTYDEAGFQLLKNSFIQETLQPVKKTFTKDQRISNLLNFFNTNHIINTREGNMESEIIRKELTKKQRKYPFKHDKRMKERELIIRKLNEQEEETEDESYQPKPIRSKIPAGKRRRYV